MSKAQCLDCLGFMESKHTHDFVKCECGNAFLDGGDSYIRAGGRIVILKDFFDTVDRDAALETLIENANTDEVFEDTILEDDIATFNLGYQAGTLDERERILKIIEDYRHKPTFGYANLIALIKGETNE